MMRVVFVGYDPPLQRTVTEVTAMLLQQFPVLKKARENGGVVEVLP